MSATQKTSPAAAVAGEVPILRIKDLTISVKSRTGDCTLSFMHISIRCRVLKKGETLAIALVRADQESL